MNNDNPNQTTTDTATEVPAEINYKDLYLRARAEYTNAQKRHVQELERAERQGIEKTLKYILPAFNSLVLASKVKKPTIKSLKSGMELVRSQFLSNLKKIQVEKISANSGEVFDPKYHEAIVSSPSSEIENGKILEEAESGFTLNGAILFPAKVIVSSGS